MTTEGLKGDQKTRLNSENFFQITQSSELDTVKEVINY